MKNIHLNHNAFFKDRYINFPFKHLNNRSTLHFFTISSQTVNNLFYNCIVPPQGYLLMKKFWYQLIVTKGLLQEHGSSVASQLAMIQNCHSVSKNIRLLHEMGGYEDGVLLSDLLMMRNEK